MHGISDSFVNLHLKREYYNNTRYEKKRLHETDDEGHQVAAPKISNSTARESADGYGNAKKEDLKSDWGTLAITNGGNTENSGWRTLSSAEWTYLLNTRTVNGGTGSGHSYTLGQSVSDKLCMVIYPDNYTGPIYTGSNWSTFQAAGCVFLPAAGYRGGQNYFLAGYRGYYWSNESASTKGYALYVRFHDESLYFSNTYRDEALSVRLVRDAD